MRLATTRTHLAALAALAVALVGVTAGCGGDDEQEAFERDVVAARDAANSSFAYIQRPASTGDLVLRLRTARDDLATASGEIALADAPEHLVDERRRLASALSDLSAEMDAAANSVALLDGAPGRVERLIFDHWDTVQAALDALREEGVEVEPLQRRGGDAGS